MKHHLLKVHKLLNKLTPKAAAYIELSLLGLALLLFLVIIYPRPELEKVFVENATTTSAAYFPPVDIEAKSAYVYDLREGTVLYEKDARARVPLASLTKLMSSYVASIVIPEYLLIRIEPEDLREEGDTGLYPGEIWTARKLSDFSLIISSNDGIRALASAAGRELATTTTMKPLDLFVAKMNSVARELGFTDTYFYNPSGLDTTKTVSGGYGSARDIALLVGHMIATDPKVLEATAAPKATIYSNILPHHVDNTNKSIRAIPNVLASKTGFTDLSGGNVVVAWNAGLDRPIVISVLGSSYDGRFRDLEALVRATLEYLVATKDEFARPE
jgi:serine-type D-Ala-D-Ala carboxypeptidase (penicillin-binding protein 5/6)